MAVAALLTGLWGCGSTAVAPPSPAVAPTPAPLPSGPPQPDGWELLTNSPSSPTEARHEDLVFLDASNGWLVNARAEVWGTQDGGATWRQLAQLVNDVFLRCVGFASRTTGWAGNLNVTSGTPRADYSLWETLDGGRTWSNISNRISGAPVVGLCGMRVVSANLIVAVGRWCGPPVFVKSTDGGRTWTSRSLSSLTGGLVDVYFVNEHDGFAVGGLGDGTTQAEALASRTVVLATTDGGETWQTRYTSTSSGQRGWKIHFASDRVGYVTTEGPSAEGVVLKTIDGGETWRPLLVSANREFEGVAFVDPDQGWVASFDTIFSTVDGGATWKPLLFGRFVNRMRVLNDSLVFACGDRAYRWRR